MLLRIANETCRRATPKNIYISVYGGELLNNTSQQILNKENKNEF